MGREHWLRLAMTEGIGPILIRRLIEAAGSAEDACVASATTLQSIDGIGSAKATKIRASMQSANVDDELRRCAAMGISVICPDDESFPTLLTQIPDPPPVLYVKGSFEPRDLNGVAIVGSRKCSFYGREQAERFGALLAGAGFTVISGGARGVDSSAHRGAMSHPQGRTIAVLGSGLDVPYPPENKGLFDQIAQGRGAVVSEYSLGTPPIAENFPRRNRIVSGLSRGVLVVEADERSGALITARQACEDHGRTVFAIPGRIDHSLSAGPHRLIREGAVLTTGIEDIINNLGPLPQSAMEPSLFASEVVEEQEQSPKRLAAVPVELTDRQERIVAELGLDPLHVDQLIERTTLQAHEVLQDLTILSLKGVIKRVDGQSYVRSAGSKR